MYNGPKLGPTLDSELGNYYSTFLWRFTDKTKNTDFNDFLVERFDAGYMLTCICFVILGSFGTSLNGRACYNFCRTKTVISEINICYHIQLSYYDRVFHHTFLNYFFIFIMCKVEKSV